MAAFRRVGTLIRCGLSASVVVFGVAADAHDHESAVRALIEPAIRPWLNEPIIVEAIAAQNTRNTSVTEPEIARLDQQWRSETKSASQPLIGRVLSNDLSEYLKKVMARSDGLFTEIFVMDNKGLNVGQSGVTSDYWQGDEAKWKKTFLAGPDVVFIDQVEEDESTQQFQFQVSLTISDPDANLAIGAITIGVNVDLLMSLFNSGELAQLSKCQFAPSCP